MTARTDARIRVGYEPEPVQPQKLRELEDLTDIDLEKIIVALTDREWWGSQTELADKFRELLIARQTGSL